MMDQKDGDWVKEHVNSQMRIMSFFVVLSTVITLFVACSRPDEWGRKLKNQEVRIELLEKQLNDLRKDRK